MSVDLTRRQAEIVMSLSNVIVATRTLLAEDVLQGHPSNEWLKHAIGALWRALGFANEETAIGFFDVAHFEIEDEWPSDARVVALCHSEKMYAIERDGVMLFASRIAAIDDARTIWSARLSFAMALLCATIGRPCSVDALSILDPDVQYA